MKESAKIDIKGIGGKVISGLSNKGIKAVGDKIIDGQKEAIDKEIKQIVNASAEFAKESPEPALEELWTDIYA